MLVTSLVGRTDTLNVLNIYICSLGLSLKKREGKMMEAIGIRIRRPERKFSNTFLSIAIYLFFFHLRLCFLLASPTSFLFFSFLFCSVHLRRTFCVCIGNLSDPREPRVLRDHLGHPIRHRMQDSYLCWPDSHKATFRPPARQPQAMPPRMDIVGVCFLPSWRPLLGLCTHRKTAFPRSGRKSFALVPYLPSFGRAFQCMLRMIRECGHVRIRSEKREF